MDPQDNQADVSTENGEDSQLQEAIRLSNLEDEMTSALKRKADEDLPRESKFARASCKFIPRVSDLQYCPTRHDTLS
jgi:hypothetical protein